MDFPTISVQRQLAGRKPRDHGLVSGHTARTPVRPHRGCYGDDLLSTLGGTGITLQFDLNRDINAAARDVEAAINAARGYLPTNLPNNPGYRKVNPAESPSFMLALTSNVLDRRTDVRRRFHHHGAEAFADQGRWAGKRRGSALPGVRVELNPMALNKYGIGMEQVRSVLNNANANIPKGHFSRWIPDLGSRRERSNV